MTENKSSEQCVVRRQVIESIHIRDTKSYVAFWILFRPSHINNGLIYVRCSDRPGGLCDYLGPESRPCRNFENAFTCKNPLKDLGRLLDVRLSCGLLVRVVCFPIVLLRAVS